MKLPTIPNEYLIVIVAVMLVILRCMGIDSWTTATLSLIVGYITGKHVEQTRTK